MPQSQPACPYAGPSGYFHLDSADLRLSLSKKPPSRSSKRASSLTMLGMSEATSAQMAHVISAMETSKPRTKKMTWCHSHNATPLQQEGTSARRAGANRIMRFFLKHRTAASNYFFRWKTG